MANKFLLLSLQGDGLGLALKLKQNGNDVAAWIRGKAEKHHYDGLIKKVTNWEDFLDKDTIVVFDSSGGGRTADRLKAQGYHVFAGSTFADSLELDRPLAMDLLAQAGVQMPRFEVFYTWEEGRAYARKANRRLVFKPTGETSKEGAIGSYVSSDPEDMMTMLSYYEGVAKHEPEFILQDFEEGVAVSTEGWFNGQEFIEPFNHTIEQKSIMNDNLGPSTGCSCDIVWRVENTNFVIEEGLRLMEPTLREYGHIGPIDLNVIVNERGVWALEFTPRFGYDASPSLLYELYEGDFGELIAKSARGEQPQEMPLRRGFASALRLSVPPHPSEEFYHQGGMPIQGFLRSDRPHIYFFEVKFDERDRFVTAKGSGAVAAITGFGETIHESFKEPYEIAKRARIPELQYRTDAVDSLSKDYASFIRYLGLRHNQLKEVGGNK